MIESEFKCLLTLEDYNTIINNIKSRYPTKTITQINYFYDTADHYLNNSDITLRIRQRESRLSLQLKGASKINNLLRTRQELSLPLDTLPISFEPGKIPWSEYIQCSSPISLVGVLVTERTSCLAQDGIEIDIDKNSYLGVTDYELEVEFAQDLQEEASRLLMEITQDRIISKNVGKRERFFIKLKELTGNLQNP